MAPSSPPDDISDADEGEVRKKVLDGLRLALDDELAERSTVERRDLTKTEEEKLLYFLAALDSDITTDSHETVFLDIVHELLDTDIDVKTVDPQEFSPEDLLN